MHICLTETIALSPDEVLELMKDADFQREKAKRVDAVEFGMAVEPGPSPKVVTRRKLSTGRMPEFIKPMLDPTITVTETEQWIQTETPAGWAGSFTIEVKGAPVQLDGSVSLKLISGGSELTFSGELVSSVPLFRSKIEESASGSVIATIETEFELLHEYAEAYRLKLSS